MDVQKLHYEWWKTEHWTINQSSGEMHSFEVICTRVLAKCTALPFDFFILLLSITANTRFSGVALICLAPHTGMASSVAGFGLIFQLLENRYAPDPLWYSCISFITCLWTFEILILVRWFKNCGNKMWKQCFTTTNEETHPAVICKHYLVK